MVPCPPMRAPLALVLATLISSPVVASAQQAPVPPAGEPPPPETRAQEQQAIAEEARQAYLRAHQDELWRRSVQEVEQERRNAWEERGRANIPPDVVTRTPTLEASLTGRCGTRENEVGLGIAASLKLRATRWWGLEGAGGLASFRGFGDGASPDARLTAAFAEASAFGSISGKSRRSTDATHGLLRAGMQVLVTLQNPNVPPTYLAPFLGFGGVFALGPLANGRGYAALLVEFRVGYRVGLKSADVSPLEGAFLDVMAGPAVGF